MDTVSMNSFAFRQTEESRFSHYVGNIEEVAKLAEKAMALGLYSSNDEDDVRTVSVDATGFFSPVVKLTEETELRARVEKRQAHEAPVKVVTAVGGDKLPASHVNVICYKRSKLSAAERSTDADWEVVTFNAGDKDEPQNPVSMARNFLGLPGGSLTNYTAQQFAEAIMYWATRAHLEG